jgi:hypothetical protein
MMWGVGVWSEVGSLIHPTGVLWDSDQDSGLASPFLECYSSQTIPSQTTENIVMLIQAIVITKLVFYAVCNRSKCPCVLPCLYFHAVLWGLSPFHEKKKKTCPQCHATSSKFHCWYYTCWQVSFSRHSPHPNLLIGLVFIGEIFGLWAAARPWNHILLNSWTTVMVQVRLFVALQILWVIVSLDIWWISWTTFFNAWCSLSVIKCGLPGHYGCAFTFPLHNHVTNRRLGRFLTDVATSN